MTGSVWCLQRWVHITTKSDPAQLLGGKSHQRRLLLPSLSLPRLAKLSKERFCTNRRWHPLPLCKRIMFRIANSRDFFFFSEPPGIRQGFAFLQHSLLEFRDYTFPFHLEIPVPAPSLSGKLCVSAASPAVSVTFPGIAD